MPAGVVGAALLPHPPIVVPGVSRDHMNRVSSTARAIREVAARIRRVSPDVIVLISPHGPVSSRGVALSAWPEMEGDLGAFGAREKRASFRGDVRLARHMVSALEAGGLQVSLEDRPNPGGIDHGSMVPLWYLDKAAVGSRLVLVSGVRGDPAAAAGIGRLLAEALSEQHLSGFFIASGDLSHRLSPGAPGGHNPDGERFDRQVVDLLSAGDGGGMLDLDPGLVRRAGECGYLPLCLVSGALGPGWKARVLSYEGPFGVGYAVASIYPAGRVDDLYVDLARASLQHHLAGGGSYPVGAVLPAELARRAAAFVSIKKEGSLRGCIGTVRPQQESLGLEIAVNAVAAGTRDPRFPPVEPAEISSLHVSVDVLGDPEPVPGTDHLDPGTYGVIVEQGGRTGLLLPRIDGIDTAAQQVDVAARKAGIDPAASGIRLQRFRVQRYGGGEGGT